MILTSSRIESARRAGDLSIEPFDPAALNPNTYNLHLAEDVLLPGDRTWVSTPIPPEGLVLGQRTMCLACTRERFGSVRFVPTLSGRSSVGRLGLFVHLVADMGNTGAVHAWTLELYPALPVRVYAGMPIVQVAFWHVDGEVTRYTGAYDLHDDATPCLCPDLEL